MSDAASDTLMFPVAFAVVVEVVDDRSELESESESLLHPAATSPSTTTHTIQSRAQGLMSSRTAPSPPGCRRPPTEKST